MTSCWPVGSLLGFFLVVVGGGRHLVISYFDFAEERVLGEKPACIVPPVQVPQAAGKDEYLVPCPPPQTWGL